MKLKWILMFVVVAIVGVFVVLPAVAPTVTTKTIVRDAQVTLGDTCALMNQSELALMMYDTALTANATDTVILKKKGEALIKCGRAQEAEDVYQQVLSQNGSDATALTRAGDSLAQLGNLTGAIHYYDTALAITPRDSKILLRKGDAYLVMSMQETQRLQAVAKELSKQPGSGYQTSSASQIETMQSYQNAMASYQKAMEIDPKLSLIVSTRVLGATQNQVSSYQEILNNLGSS